MAYFLGSFSSADWVGRQCGVNLMEFGSKNLGATNVFRVLGAKWGITVFVMDVSKGAIPVLYANYLGYEFYQSLIVGIVAVVGHCYSIFYRFKGGKGAATLLGVIIALHPFVAGVTLLVWAIVLVCSRRMALATIVGAITFGTVEYLQPQPLVFRWIFVSVAVLIVLRHIPNIKRLLAGQEKPLWEWRREKV